MESLQDFYPRGGCISLKDEVLLGLSLFLLEGADSTHCNCTDAASKAGFDLHLSKRRIRPTVCKALCDSFG